MKISSGVKAKLIYKLKTDKGKIIEEINDSNPAEFVFGIGQLLPDFEQNLSGLNSGDEFDFSIKAENAYGPIDPYAIFDIPLDTFEVDGKIDEKMIQIGNVLPMTDNEGNKHHGKIIKILKDAITLDFNHPLAGENLNFVGKVISVETNK
ncbi:MAG: peptidylprolyl isomerase [Marinilabiliales bacterium]|nr:MAG: peptidylprolyl isomerase [Marinilabiliales bacterium]